MATMLQISLIGPQGGLSTAAEIAVNGVHELVLDTSDVTIIDPFDPFACRF